MPAPPEPTTVDAFEAVQGFSPDQLDQLITNEVGDPMLGAFNSLAKATFPGADEDSLARAVHLMVLAYLMNSHANGTI